SVSRQCDPGPKHGNELASVSTHNRCEWTLAWPAVVPDPIFTMLVAAWTTVGPSSAPTPAATIAMATTLPVDSRMPSSSRPETRQPYMRREAGTPEQGAADGVASAGETGADRLDLVADGVGARAARRGPAHDGLLGGQ